MAQISPTILVIPVVFGLSVLWQAQLNKKFDFKCANCGNVFSVSALAGATTAHSLGRKRLTCPECGQTTWATRVPKP
jgi:hypothetical protein